MPSRNTQLPPDGTLSLKNLTSINNDKQASGGTPILIRKDVIHSHINIKSNLRVTLQKTIKAV